jgi:hypothetical protein
MSIGKLHISTLDLDLIITVAGILFVIISYVLIGRGVLNNVSIEEAITVGIFIVAPTKSAAVSRWVELIKGGR